MQNLNILFLHPPHVTRRTTTFLKPKNVTCTISHSIIIEEYIILMATWHFCVYHMNHNLFNQSYPVAVCLIYIVSSVLLQSIIALLNINIYAKLGV